MPTACDIGKKKVDNLNSDSEARNKTSHADVIKRTKQVADSERAMEKARIKGRLAEIFVPDTVITEEDFDQAIIDLFGKDERRRLLHKIDDLYETNEMLRDVFDDIIQDHVYINQHSGSIFRNIGQDGNPIIDPKTGMTLFNKIGTGSLSPSS